MVAFSVFSTVRCEYCMYVNICIGRYSLLAGLVKILIICLQNKWVKVKWGVPPKTNEIYTTGWRRRRDGEREVPSNSCNWMRSSTFLKAISFASICIIQWMSHRLCLKSFWTAYIDNIKAGFYIHMTVDVLSAGVSRAVDLCAAPGSWSQVLSRKLRSVTWKCTWSLVHHKV